MSDSNVEGTTWIFVTPPAASRFRRRAKKKNGLYCNLCDCYMGHKETDAVAHESGRKHVERLRCFEEGSAFHLRHERRYCKLCKTPVFLSRGVSTSQEPALAGARTVMVRGRATAVSALIRWHCEGRRHRRRWEEFHRMREKELRSRDADAIAPAIISTFAETFPLPRDVTNIILELVGLRKLPQVGTMALA